ncbi:hypothetical protein UK82_27015 [Frankia sp. ACN1ag]|nr:hypothetical protein UK82_27015 [Frankia sp. ACN1ag]
MPAILGCFFLEFLRISIIPSTSLRLRMQPVGSRKVAAGVLLSWSSVASAQAEQLDGLLAGVGERVRDMGVELGDLAGHEFDVVLAEQQAQPAGQHVEPLVLPLRQRSLANPGSRRTVAHR